METQNFKIVKQIDDWFSIESEGKFGLCDKKHNVVAACIYDSIDGIDDRGFRTYSFKVAQNGKFGAISEMGDVLIPCVYESIELYGVLEGFNAYSKGFPFQKWLLVTLNGKYGVFSEYGTEIIPCIYDGIDHLQINGQRLPVRVCLNGFYGYHNKLRAEKITEPIYSDAAVFEGDYTIVVKDGDKLLLDKKGNEFDFESEEYKQYLCGLEGHDYKLQKIDYGMNINQEYYTCQRCGHSIIENDFHWSQE